MSNPCILFLVWVACMNIIKAGLEHIDDVAKLFNLYRQFYHCRSNLKLAKEYISERLHEQACHIFLAQDNEGAGLGFVLLYPTFCSLEMDKIYILHDLYVSESARKQGVGEALMMAAKQLAEENRVARIDLLTAKDNFAGQHLYEKLGYQQSLNDYFGYSLQIKI